MFFARSLFTASPKSYVGKAVVGAGMYFAGEKLMEHSRRNNPTMETPQEPVAEHDSFGKAQQALAQRQRSVSETNPVQQFVAGMDPRTWEMPHHFHRARTLTEYAVRTSSEDRRSDAVAAGKEGLKKGAEKIWEAPSKTLEATRKASSVAQGVHKHGPEKIERALESHGTLEAGNASRQLGTNLMLAAPLSLFGGPIGATARLFMMAKMAGNMGRTVNDIHRATGAEDGVIMQTVHKRVDTIHKSK